MSKPVYITTDSTCDLPRELAERFHIKVAPLHVTLGEETYLDGVSFTPEMIYERYAKDGVLPRTAAVSPQEFSAFFGELTDAGYEVVHLDLSSELSGTYQNAVIAAQDLPGVYPVDSRSLTTGMGLMALHACRLRDEGMDAASIAQALRDLIPKVNVSFVIDTLEYMWKGGRCTGVAAFGANLLKLKPCIEMRDGRLEISKKYRGSIAKVYEKFIEERLTGVKVQSDSIFISSEPMLSGPEQDRFRALVQRLAPGKEVLFGRLSCTVTSHCGPGTLGVLFIEE